MVKRSSVYLFVLILTFSMPLSVRTMEIYWDSGPNTQLVLSGEIRGGDSEKFRNFIRANFEKYKKSRFIRLASNGGNLIEALKLAGMMKSLYPNIIVDKDKCSSSCFFLFLSGVERYVVGTSLVGVHRPYFDPLYFANLTPDEAKVQQEKLQTLINEILDENQVPQYLKEQINRTSSSEIYWLSEADLENIGNKPAWFEELLIAKCEYGKYKSLWATMKNTSPDDPRRRVISESIDETAKRLVGCEDKVISSELTNLPPIFAGNSSATLPTH